MELQGERLIPVAQDKTWAALNDPQVLKACITGCESLERSADDAFAAVVAVKVGPVSARFKGSLKLVNVQAPHSYTLNFDGQGGVAGFAKGTADVTLAAEGQGDAAATRLKYSAKAQVGGKMAQVGSRLIDAAAAKVTDEFFRAFEAQLAPPPPAGADTGQVPLPADTPKGNRALWWGIAAMIAALLWYWLSKQLRA
ncbi:MAG TPA: carbon monoxide dehydrogenase subunit G [Rubrivivax sp.]|nr:carbon monoxide dehydrogenase subunit G [Rubrivivax sp.]